MTKAFLVEIGLEPHTPPRPWTDRQTGMQKMLPGSQKAYIHQGAKYPVQIAIDVPVDAQPLKPGFYLLAGECFTAGDYGRPAFSSRNLELVPLDDAIAGFKSIASPPAQLKAAG